MSPMVLGQALALLEPQHDPNLLVGISTADDAGVVKLTDELALVQTVDFFTPIVDDPYTFGRIAATNALSDVYAMGGRPVSALNLVAFPLESLGGEVLGEMRRGGLVMVTSPARAVVEGDATAARDPRRRLARQGELGPYAVLPNAGGRAG